MSRSGAGAGSEHVLGVLGGAIAVVTVDCLLKKVAHWIRLYATKPDGKSRPLRAKCAEVQSEHGLELV